MHISTLHCTTYRIYKVPEYRINQEHQQNVNHQWSYAYLTSLVLSSSLKTEVSLCNEHVTAGSCRCHDW